MRILLDTNIILDFFLERQPFYLESSQLFDAIASGTVQGFLSASSATDIFYISRRQTRSIETARHILRTTLELLTACPVTQAILDTAFHSGIPDFEDAVQIACAVAAVLDAIAPRDPVDFQNSPVPARSIVALLNC
ncbi:MAG: PIN domain-containing protein [Synechococcales bacterium]|nr:PIN domain-containing protein [Synechococcales bacterium]